VVGALVFAFLVGVAVGVLIGRRAPRPDATPTSAAGRAVAVTGPAPTKRGRKAGLTDESFTPTDDILEKLRLAAEGELDPSAFAEQPPPRQQPEAPPERPAAVDPRLAEAEQRILDRLRRQAETGDDGSEGSA